MFLSQDEVTQSPCPAILSVVDGQPNDDVPPKRLKKRPLLLDARTELTDEELMVRMSTISSKGNMLTTCEDCSSLLSSKPGPVEARNLSENIRKELQRNYDTHDLGCARLQ